MAGIPQSNSSRNYERAVFFGAVWSAAVAGLFLLGPRFGSWGIWIAYSPLIVPVAAAGALAYVFLALAAVRQIDPHDGHSSRRVLMTHLPLYASWVLVFICMVPIANVHYLAAISPHLLLVLLAFCGWLSVREFAPKLSEYYLLAAAMAIAFVLRLEGLTRQSMWNDELLSMVQCDPANSMRTMLDRSYAWNDLPPLYFVFLWVWMNVLGEGEFTARLFSVLLGTASVAAIYQLGKTLFNGRAGLIAALFTAINWSHMLHSQEARPYIQVFLLATLSYLAFVYLIERPSPLRAAAWTAVNLLLLYTHYFGWLVLMAQLAAAGLMIVSVRGAPVRQLFTMACQGAAAVVIGFLPAAQRMFASFSLPSFWAEKPGSSAILQLYPYFFHDTGLALLMGGLTVLPLLREYLRGPAEDDSPRHNTALLLLATWILVCYFVPYTHSVNSNTSVLVFRYLLILLPPILLLAAAASDLIPSLSGRVILLSVIVLMTTLDVFSVSQFHHRNAINEYRELVYNLPAEARPYYFAKPKQTFKFGYYLKKRGIDEPVHEASLPEMHRVLQEAGSESALRLWVLENVQGTYGQVTDAEFLDFLQENFTLEREQTAHMVRAREYAVAQDRYEAVRSWITSGELEESGDKEAGS